MKKFLFLFIFVFLVTSVHAQVRHYLTAQEILRVKAVKVLLDGIDKRTLSQTIDDLEKTPRPWAHLAMMEAMAKAYTDIARDYKVYGQQKKEWLYSMVCLNMAYLQFGGDGSERSTDLNRLIRQELKKYLSPEVLKQSGSLYSLS